MESDTVFKKPRERRLILGCGYLGRRVAAAWRQSNRCILPNLLGVPSGSSDEGDVSSDGNMGDQACDYRCGDTYDMGYAGVEATVRTTLAQSELQKDPTLRGIPIHRMDVTQSETMSTVLHAPPSWQVLSSNLCLPMLSSSPSEPLPSLPAAAFQPWTTILWTIGFDATQSSRLTREDVYLGGLENLLRILDEAETDGKPLLAPHGRLLFCSSTGVYGNAAGHHVIRFTMVVEYSWRRSVCCDRIGWGVGRRFCDLLDCMVKDAFRGQRRFVVENRCADRTILSIIST